MGAAAVPAAFFGGRELMATAAAVPGGGPCFYTATAV